MRRGAGLPTLPDRKGKSQQANNHVPQHNHARSIARLVRLRHPYAFASKVRLRGLASAASAMASLWNRRLV